MAGSPNNKIAADSENSSSASADTAHMTESSETATSEETSSMTSIPVDDSTTDGHEVRGVLGADANDPAESPGDRAAKKGDEAGEDGDGCLGRSEEPASKDGDNKEVDESDNETTDTPRKPGKDPAKLYDEIRTLKEKLSEMERQTKGRPAPKPSGMMQCEG
jgi:hypothetical protein